MTQASTAAPTASPEKHPRAESGVRDLKEGTASMGTVARKESGATSLRADPGLRMMTW